MNFFLLQKKSKGKEMSKPKKESLYQATPFSLISFRSSPLPKIYRHSIPP
jgi:hypothetical protein